MINRASQEIQMRLARARVARLATASKNGTPHVVPFCFAVIGDTIVSAVDQKPKTTTSLKRLANIAANPAVSMILDHYDDDWSELWWIRIDGNARVATDEVERAAALDALALKYPQYMQDRPQGPVIVITPTSTRSWP